MVTEEILPSILEGLNEPQRLAVTHERGPVLILAGPGSGKTRVITHRVAWLVRERRIPPWRILAVTFTNKAAREMRERSALMLGEDARSLSMGTFHSLCARWLRTDGQHVGVDPHFVIYDDADQVALMKRVIEDLNVDPRKFTPRMILGAISSAKSEMVSPETYRGGVKSYFEEVVGRGYIAYDRALRDASALDFDDLLLEAVRMLQESDAVREKYAGRFQHVMVDEFQDTNPVQYQLAKLLASGWGNICVVGDPDQGIYSWRSADIRNVQYFERDFPGCAVYLLEQNYRSTKPILAAADAVIGKNKDRKPRTLWTDRPGGELITTYDAYNDEEEGEFVCGEIARLVRTGLKHRDIAVMYRTNAQSRAVEDALVRHRIRYRLIGGVRFYQRREIKDVIAYLRLIYNRLDEASLLRVINTPTRGIGDRTLNVMRAAAAKSGVSLAEVVERVAGGTQFTGISPRSASSVREFAQMMNSLREFASGSVSTLLEELLTATGYGVYVRESGEDAQERIENIDELRGLIEQYDGTATDGGDLAIFLQDVALVADVDELPEGETEDAVTLITLHTAKGLEYPVVFMVGLEEGVLPHIRSFDDPKQMEEERRLAYVGITRAKDHLYLSRSYRRFMMGGSSNNPPSRFLADIPKHLTKPFGSGPRSYIEAVTAPAATEFRPETAAWKASDRVQHPKFGVGTVVAVAERKGDVELTVAFDAPVGLKKLLQSFAPLMRA
ncbi:hypothetical protein AYO38_00445 [bacterium SCGC AG-212-C10]|nr:hypothetical protein AYO38_00445 [bacterium SCGC AG-212-C10]